MKKLNMFLGVFISAFLLTPTVAQAVCPVCTIAVGGLLILFESLGIPDLIFPGIWAGGLTMSLALWTASYMNRRGVKNGFWYLLDFIIYYGLLVLAYFVPMSKPLIVFKESTLVGIDQFLLGIILGSVVFYIAVRWYSQIKRNNGGHAKYPFQKVVMSVGSLLLLTGIFAAILYI